MAADVDRQRLLQGLRVALELLERDVRAGVARLALGEEPAQRLQRLLEDLAAPRAGAPRPLRLELLAIGAQAHAEDDAAAREAVERGRLLGQQHGIAQRQHDEGGAEVHAARVGAHRGQRDERFVEARRVAPLLAHVRRGRHVIVAPHAVVAEALGGLREAHEVLRPRERHGIHEALGARGQLHAEAHGRQAARPSATATARAVSVAV